MGLILQHIQQNQCRRARTHGVGDHLRFFLRFSNPKTHFTVERHWDQKMSHNVKAIRRFCGCDKGNRRFPLSQKCAYEKTHKGRSPTAFFRRPSRYCSAAYVKRNFLRPRATLKSYHTLKARNKKTGIFGTAASVPPLRKISLLKKQIALWYSFLGEISKNFTFWAVLASVTGRDNG
ncbi:MAG: hypothetical protein Ta2B_14510 [Termitinemataceae bacterium]|nr:MAG: hypothetical protein Ta2B_14510 [Termitinemataceae bacterium]